MLSRLWLLSFRHSQGHTPRIVNIASHRQRHSKDEVEDMKHEDECLEARMAQLEDKIADPCGATPRRKSKDLTAH